MSDITTYSDRERARRLRVQFLESVRTDGDDEGESAPPLETGCAWCAEELGLTPREAVSYGICERHRHALLEEAFALRHAGKRADQVWDSLTIVAGAVLLAVIGFAVGAGMAVWRFAL